MAGASQSPAVTTVPVTPPPEQPGDCGGVLIVEDHAMLAQALALGLADMGIQARVADLATCLSVPEQATRLHPALVLLDLDLDGCDGLDLLPELRANDQRVLVVTGERDESRLAAAVALGAEGWVSKSEPFERLLAAIEGTLRERPLLDAATRAELAAAGRSRLRTDRELKERVSTLTAREREVLEALASGDTAQDIATRFFVSLGTVRTHIRAILSKLGVSSQLAAVARTRQLAEVQLRGLVGDDHRHTPGGALSPACDAQAPGGS